MKSIKSGLKLTTVLSTSLALVFSGLPIRAFADPQDGSVVVGSATVGSNSNITTINQSSDKAIIDWRAFNVAPTEQVIFNQPSKGSITLNRVTGGDPSDILGSISANGQVWLINPNGIAFGKTARVDVAGLLATTLDINNADFMSGNYRFAASHDGVAKVTNAGNLTISGAGLAALVAPNVSNSGLIRAQLGRIVLASTQGFTLDFYGDGIVNFLLNKDISNTLASQSGTVSNSGKMIANGGWVILSANTAKAVVDQTINMTGFDEANSVDVKDGNVSLLGSTGQVAVSGSIDVSGKTGGNIAVTGGNVSLSDTANLSAAGTTAGGTILIGGDYQGKGQLANATNTTIAAGALIDVSATEIGNAGRAIVWSDDTTSFAGTIKATGGASSGNGGFVEVSGHNRLDYTGKTDLRAKNGTQGTLLLDPRNVSITNGGDTAPSLPTSGASTFNPASNDSILQVSTLQTALSLGNVIVTTGSDGTQAGDITVASNVTWSNGSHLTLSAARDIVVSDGTTIKNTGAGDLNLRADSAGSGTGTVSFNGTGMVDYTGSTGQVSIFYNPSSYNTPASFSANILTNAALSRQLTAYMLVNNLTQLQAVNTNLSGDYALGRDIDASGSSTNGGFLPIQGAYAADGSVRTFSGTFDGQRHAITNLTLALTTRGEFGLFGANSGIIKDLSLNNVTLNALSPQGKISGGFVVNSNSGTVKNVYAQGILRVGNQFQSQNSEQQTIAVGGIVGANQRDGKVISAASNVDFSIGAPSGGFYFAGGITGANFGYIEQAYSKGQITAAGGYLGGLIGYAISSQIYDSYSQVNINGGSPLGGSLVGSAIGFSNSATGERLYSTGAVQRTGGDPFYPASFVGYRGGGVDYYRNTYFDSQTSGIQNVNSANGLTTAQLKNGLPAGFDPNVWAIDAAFNNGYPYLKWQRPVAIAAPTVVAFGVVAVTPPPTPVPTPVPTPTPVPVPVPTPIPLPTLVPVPLISSPAVTVALNQTDRAPLVFYGPPRPVAPRFVRPGIGTDGRAINLWARGLSREDAAGAALDYAHLANAAYGAPGDVSTGFSDWKLERSWYGILKEAYGNTLTPDQYAKLEKDIAASGFSATLYQKDGKYVLAFRGTEGATNFADMKTNVKQLLGLKTGGQYDFAKLIGEIVTNKYESVTFTGHSLGGGLAQYASLNISPKPQAITFNAAGISGFDGFLQSKTDSVINFRIKGDGVSSVGKQFGLSTYEYANDIENLTSIERLNPAVKLWQALSYNHVGGGGAEVVIRTLQNSWANR